MGTCQSCGKQAYLGAEVIDGEVVGYPLCGECYNEYWVDYHCIRCGQGSYTSQEHGLCWTCHKQGATEKCWVCCDAPQRHPDNPFCWGCLGGYGRLGDCVRCNHKVSRVNSADVCVYCSAKEKSSEAV